MSCSEGFTPCGYILFDRHVRVTESDKANLIALFSKNSKLLGLTGCSLRRIILREFLATVCDHLFLAFFFAESERSLK